MIRGNNILILMDSHLEGNYSTEAATSLVNLASRCLQSEPRERPDVKTLVSILTPLQSKLEVFRLFFNSSHSIDWAVFRAYVLFNQCRFLLI